jgi:DNA-binding FrmR family transcriptional regulator
MARTIAKKVGKTAMPPGTTRNDKFQQHKDSLISRLKRIEGQVRGIQAMVEREEECEDVARQLAAARAALDRAFFEMVACSIERQLGESASSQTQAAVEEVSRILAKYG